MKKQQIYLNFYRTFNWIWDTFLNGGMFAISEAAKDILGSFKITFSFKWSKQLG